MNQQSTIVVIDSVTIKISTKDLQWDHPVYGAWDRHFSSAKYTK
jgi:hypothetical protein